MIQILKNIIRDIMRMYTDRDIEAVRTILPCLDDSSMLLSIRQIRAFNGEIKLIEEYLKIRNVQRLSVLHKTNKGD